MAEAPNLLYIVVVDDDEKPSSSSSSSSSTSFRYTRSLLRSALQLMGCKARHAFKISRRVFEVMRDDCSVSASNFTLSKSSREYSPRGLFYNVKATNNNNCLGHPEGPMTLESLQRYNSIWFDLYKKLTTVFVPRENFLTVVCQTLSQYKYVGPKQREDFALACRIRERKESVTVLLCGTSGCGKSTLSALLGSRLGVTTVVSTDSIRHMMRSYVDEKQNPLLWSSTYHAGEHLDPVAVAKAKRKAKKVVGISYATKRELGEGAKSENEVHETFSNNDLVGAKQMAIEGFKAQSEMVIESLDRLITAWEERKESVVVEGVHLSLNFVMGLMKKHPSIIPFMVYISNEEKHLERFAVRAKYMTLDPTKNKYVKYIRNIRAIQEYLCNRADKHLVPKVNNTNVDRSVAAIHATVFSCLRRRAAGEPLYDQATNTVPLIDEEYRNQRAANSLSSKRMFQLIQHKGSSRHLMALLNTDGSVAKAWPVESIYDGESFESEDGIRKNADSPLYGPLQIGKAEPVNLQFGSFGISAWPSDTCGSSYAGSADDSRADGTDTGSKCFSSCCSSPRISDGPSKELKEESSVSGSDYDNEDPNDKYTDEEVSDLDNEEIHEMEGSVDEESIKSDEGYEELIVLDGIDNGYCSDNDEPYKEDKTTKLNSTVGNEKSEDTKYQQNSNVLLRSNNPLLESPCSAYYSPVLLDISARSLAPRSRRHSLGDSAKSYARSRSFPATMSKEGSKVTDPILSGAP